MRTFLSGMRAKPAWAAGIAAGTLLAGGAAFATLTYTLWNTQESGTGKAAATSLTFAVSADSSPTAQLFPGGNGDVTFYMTNPNAFQITVTNATLDASTPHFASSVANCDNGVSANGSTANPVSFAFASANGTGLTLAPNTTTPQKVTLHNNATMASTADNACQGQTFSATLDVTATQSSGS